MDDMKKVWLIGQREWEEAGSPETIEGREVLVVPYE